MLLFATAKWLSHFLVVGFWKDRIWFSVVQLLQLWAERGWWRWHHVTGYACVFCVFQSAKWYTVKCQVSVPADWHYSLPIWAQRPGCSTTLSLGGHCSARSTWQRWSEGCKCISYAKAVTGRGDFCIFFLFLFWTPDSLSVCGRRLLLGQGDLRDWFKWPLRVCLVGGPFQGGRVYLGDPQPRRRRW